MGMGEGFFKGDFWIWFGIWVFAVASYYIGGIGDRAEFGALILSVSLPIVAIIRFFQRK